MGACAALVVHVGCSVDRSGLAGRDAGRRDTGPDADASPSDAGETDAPDGQDAGAMDARVDAMPMDAGRDTGTADAGCLLPAGSSEQAIAAPAPGTLTLDGQLDEWDRAAFVELVPGDDWVSSSESPPSTSDLSARFALMWTAEALYLGVEVTDDVAHNDFSGWDIWRGDSVQAGFDVAHDETGPEYDDTDDFEYGWARTDEGLARYRWVAPSGAAAPSDELEMSRSGGVTTYEVRLHAADLGLGALEAGRTIGFELIVNENDDSDDREGWLEWASGLGAGKDPREFYDLVLVACESPS